MLPPASRYRVRYENGRDGERDGELGGDHIALLHQDTGGIEETMMLDNLAVAHRPPQRNIGLDRLAGALVKRLDFELSQHHVALGQDGLGFEADKMILREHQRDMRLQLGQPDAHVAETEELMRRV